MDHSFWDALSIEVGYKVNQVARKMLARGQIRGMKRDPQILQQERTVLAHSLCLIGMGHGDTVAGGVENILRLGLAVFFVIAIVVRGMLSKRGS